MLLSPAFGKLRNVVRHAARSNPNKGSRVVVIHQARKEDHALKTIIICSVFLFLFGCSTKTVFVVLRDVPENPSFVVIPASDYLYQIELANMIEAFLISSGVKVVTRPAIKEVQATKQASQVDAQSSQPVGAQATLTERYVAFEDTNADFIVETYADNRQVKIIRKATKEILATFELTKPQTQKKDQVIIQNALRSIGVPIR